MPLVREEQETTVNWEYASDTITVSTSYPPHMRALVKLGYEPKVSRVVTKWDVSEDKKGRVTQTPAETDEVTWTFTLPSEYFKLPRPKRRVSEEQRAARSERMRRRGD